MHPGSGSRRRRRLARGWLVAAWLVAGSAARVARTAELDARVLDPARPVRHTLAGGETAAYRFRLEAGQFARVTLDKQGVAIVLTLLAPDGSTLVESDSPNGIFGPDFLWIVAETSGEYGLRLGTSEPGAPRGSYEVRISDPRIAGPRDRKCAEAQRISYRADTLHAEQKAESLRESLERYQRAADLWREADEPAGLGRTLFFFAVAQADAGRRDLQMALLRELLDLQPRLHDRGFEATTQTWFALGLDGLGKRREALPHFDRAIQIQRELGDPMSESISLFSRSLVRAYLGDHEGGFADLFRVLAIVRAQGDKTGESRALGQIAGLYSLTGEADRAIEFYERTLTLDREAGDPNSQAITANNLGWAFGNRGDWARELEQHQKALELSRGTGNHRVEGMALSGIARARLKLGDPDGALQDYTRALESARASHDPQAEALAQYGIGEVHLASGRLPQAREAFEASLNLRRSDPAEAAKAAAAIARILRDEGDLPGARSRAEEAVSLAETFRSGIATPFRASYLGAVLKYYELEIDVLMRMHRRNPAEGLDVRALEVSERSRARTLADLLVESHANVRESVDPGLLDRETALRRNLSSRLDEQLRLRSAGAPEDKTAAIAKSVDSLSVELAEVQALIRSGNPRYAELVLPEPDDAGRIRDLLDPDTVLIEYALGDERSVLWAVTRDGIASRELAGKNEIETAARALYGTLAVPATPSGGTAGPGDAAAARLSELVLSPLRGSRLLEQKRVVIVADGALQFIPFGVLPAGERARPLIQEHEVVHLPSSSALTILRRETSGRRPAEKTLAVLADPVFEKDDPRVTGGRASAGAPGGSGPVRSEDAADRRLRRAARDVGIPETGMGISRLPRTRQEARAILDLVPPGDRKEALGFAASRSAAVDPELSRYRFVHFATHGFLDTTHPELSGLVFSLVDRRGREQVGFLSGFEVFNLKLPADLVVLSACRTALGKDVRGEGLVGLTRAFMYAGTPRVVASLWRVDDSATAELMRRFYEGMLGPEKLPASAALRKAQLSIAATRRWADPYYWAGFVLQGDWR